MDRQLFENAVKANLETNIYYHSLALEACMLALYDYLKPTTGPSKEDWGLAGLIHDIDYAGETKPDHPYKTLEVLKKYKLEISPVVDRIVKDHCASTGLPAGALAQAGWAIRCADSLTGLITATALVYPSKKLADVKLSSVVKRFLKEPKFAAGTRREEVALCQTMLNIPLEKFIEICFLAMQKIAPKIGL